MTHVDKKGQPIEPGDHVSFVHFGEAHTAKVDRLSHELAGIPTVHAHVQVAVPAASTTKKEPAVAEKKVEERTEKPEERKPEPRPEPAKKAEPHKRPTHTT